MAEEVVQNPQLKILLCGRTGVGKSSLVNSLLGQEVCEVSVAPGLPGGSLKPCTMAVTPYTVDTVDLGGVRVTVFDSPGLQDGTGNEIEYVDKMYNDCKDVDLVLYCTTMTECRFISAEDRAMSLITKKFGPKFWGRCVLVLTKANCVYIPPAYRVPQEKVDYHENLFKNVQAEFCSRLQKVGVSKSSIVDHTVAAGYFDYETNDNPDRLIHYASKYVKASVNIEKGLACKRKEKLELVDFINELWVTCLCRLPNESRDRFLQATALDGRVTVKDDGSRQSKELREILVKAAKDLHKSIRKSVPVPIVIDHPSQRERMIKALKHYGPATAVGGVGGLIIGGTVGFFAAGPVGAVFGAVAGGGGGAVAGATSQAIYSWFTGSKKDKIHVDKVKKN